MTELHKRMSADAPFCVSVYPRAYMELKDIASPLDP